MKSSLSSHNGYDLLALEGEIDLSVTPSVREKILDTLKGGKPLLIDMAEVSYIDSSGIASLVEGFQKAKSSSLAYGILNISEPTLQVLTLTRLDKIFSLYDNADQFQALLQTQS